jgi:hypothetical protein
MFLTYKLMPQNAPCPFNNVKDMAFAIIKEFKISQLRFLDPRGTSSIARPLKAHYQDEFYRGLFAATNGSIIMFSEYSCSPGPHPGRIDFFVPAKRWGIEILQNGSDLVGHNSHFSTQGAYGKWLSQSKMEDYVLLDFRTSMPQKKRLGMSYFIHGLFVFD